MEDKLLEAAKKLCTSLHGAGSLSSFGYLFTNGSSWIETGRDCYYHLSTVDARNNNRTPLYFCDWSLDCLDNKDEGYPDDYDIDDYDVQCPDKRAITPRDRTHYVKWLANESAFADAFVVKDPKFILTQGSILDCQYPLRYLLHAAMAVRYIYEYPSLVRHWLILSKYMNKDGAFVLGHYLSYNSRTNAGPIMVETPGLTNNHTLFAPAGLYVLKNIVRHNPDFKNDKPASEKPWGYRPLYQVWATKGEMGKDIKIPKKFLTSIDIGTDWAQESIDGLTIDTLKERGQEILDAIMG